MKNNKFEDLIINKSEDKVILLIHGIFGSPMEFIDFYNQYEKEDYSIYGIKLLPYSDKPKDYKSLDMNSWVVQLNFTLDKLLKEYKEVNIIAHSLGAILALQARNINKVNKLVLWAPAIKTKMSFASFKVGMGLGNDPYFLLMRETSSVDSKGLINKIRLIKPTMYLLPIGKNAVKNLPNVTTDILVIISKNDESVKIKSGDIIMENISSKNKEFIKLETSYHNLIDDSESYIYDKIINFIKT